MWLLYSTRRGALTARCLRDIHEREARHAAARSILIVPEQTKMDMEKAYFALGGRTCLMFTEILSFRRLAWRLLGEAGLQPLSVVDPVGQAMLIHKVLRQNQADLHAFGHLADKPGFIRDAADVIGDLKRYHVSADDLRSASAAASDRGLRNKAHDLAILLEHYDQALRETGLADSEDDLNRLAALLSEPGGIKPAWLRETSFWVCGFAEYRDFTPQEDAILSALEKLGETLTITAVADQIPFDALSVDTGADCFLNGRKAALRLTQRFPGCPVERLPDLIPGVQARIAGLFTGTAVPLRGTGGAKLRLAQMNGLDDEMSWIAGEIRRLVQTAGYRYSDISIALCDLPGASPRLRAVCREYGIPLFLDVEKPLSGTPLARFAISLLDIALHGWNRNALMACLRSGLAPLSQPEIDSLENAWLARGLFTRRRIFDNQKYGEPAMISLRDKALKPIRDFLGKLGAEPTGKGKCILFRAFLRDYGVHDKIRIRSTGLAASGDIEAAVALVQAWNEMSRLLDQRQQLSGGMDLSLQAFRDTLAAGIDSASGGVIPTAVDQVAAGNLKRAMLRQCKVLFLAGASADMLPPALSPEGLLRDQDRQTLSAALNRQLPSSFRDQVFSDAFNLYTLLTLPSDILCVTSPKAAASSWFHELAALEPEAVIRPAEPPRPPSDGGAAAGSAGETDQMETRLVRSLYAGNLVLSVSQLEKYAACPFMHFAANLLELKEREIWQPSSADTGTLLHGIAELALRALSDEMDGLDPEEPGVRGAVLQRWLDSDLSARVSGWMAEAARRGSLERFYDAGLNASAGRRVRLQFTASLRAILRQYLDSSYRPASFEWTFGPGQPEGLAISLPDGTPLSFRGKVDRVDLLDSPGGGQYRIVDYKSGDKSADFDSLYNGLSLQLPVYLAAFGKSHPGRQPADAAYFRFDRPVIRLDSARRPDPEKLAAMLDKSFALRGMGLTAEQLALLCRHSLRAASRLAGGILGGDFRVLPGKLQGKAPCDYCPMIAVCGFDGKPAGYRHLQILRGRPGDSGKPVRKRHEMILRLQEEEAGKGGGA